MARVPGVVAVVPVRVVADRLGGGAAGQPVAAADLHRLARQRDDAVHQIGIHFGPHPGVHPAHRAADHQPQMPDPEPLGDKAVAAIDHVAIAVTREFALQPVRRLARPAAADRVLHDEKVFCRVERLAGTVQLVGQRWAQPVGAGAGIALQQQHAVDDFPSCVAPGHAHRAVMQPEFRQHLAAGEDVILDEVISLGVVRPTGCGVEHGHGRYPVQVRSGE